MKKLLLAIVAASILTFTTANLVHAASYVRGYYRSNGTYVNSYYRSNRNSYRYDNYSARGNYNPYTGRRGYKSW